MKCFYFFVIAQTITLLSTKIQAKAGTGNCILSGVSDDDWQFGYTNSQKINDYVRGVVAEFNAENIVGISSQNGNYLQAALNSDKTKLTISTNEQFEHFEEIETKAQITINIAFACESGTASLSYFQNVEDVNNHLPSFNKDEYVFQLAMPWPQLDLTLLQDVTVTDIDFKNRKIQFNIEENDFVDISYDSTKGDQKHYFAVISPKRSFRITENLTLQITSTDDMDVYGTQHTETARIVLAVDAETSIPPVPYFQQPSYQGQYKDDNTINVENIEIDSGTYDDSIVTNLTGDFSSHFSVQNAENVYSLKLESPIEQIDWPDLGYSVLYLEATNPNADQPGRTVIILNFPVDHGNSSTTTTTMTTTTEAITTTTETPGPPQPLHFPDPQMNFFTKNESFLGLLIQKTAIVVPSAEIIYSLNVSENGYGRISIDSETADVTVDALLSPDLYTMTVFANTDSESAFYSINLTIIVTNDDSLYDYLYKRNQTLILTNIILVIVLTSLIFGSISGFYYMARYSKQPKSYTEEVLSTKPPNNPDDDSKSNNQPSNESTKSEDSPRAVFLLPDNLVGSSNDVDDIDEKLNLPNKAKRKKSVVTFNDTVEEIGISRL